MHKDWLIKQNKSAKTSITLSKENFNGKSRVYSKKLYLMPEVETDPTIGIKCLILDYSRPLLDVTEYLNTSFCTKLKLEEPLVNLADRLNQYVY